MGEEIIASDFCNGLSPFLRSFTMILVRGRIYLMQTKGFSFFITVEFSRGKSKVLLTFAIWFTYVCKSSLNLCSAGKDVDVEMKHELVVQQVVL